VLLKLNIPYVTQNKAKVRCKFTKFADPRTKFCRVGEGGGGRSVPAAIQSVKRKRVGSRDSTSASSRYIDTGEDLWQRDTRAWM